MDRLEQQETELIDGAYRLGPVLGEGGKGVVYRAIQVSIDRQVAIKLLKPDMENDPVELQRFHRELIASGMLHHPNIVETLSAGMHNDQMYLVMEYVSGSSLKDIIAAEKTINLVRAISITSDICAALQHSHEHGIVHRDIKPANILITSRNGRETAILADFGIARVMPESGRQMVTLTESAAVVGSPVYMSPEQAARKAVDSRSDTYSLACVLYEMLAGKPPFEGATAFDTMFKHLYEQPVKLDQVDSTIPNAISVVVTKALAKEAVHRFQSANQFAGALQEAQRSTSEPLKLKRYVLLSILVGVFATLLYFLGNFSTGNIDRTNADTNNNFSSWQEAEVNYCKGNFTDAETIAKNLLQNSARTRVLNNSKAKTDPKPLYEPANEANIRSILLSTLRAQQKWGEYRALGEEIINIAAVSPIELERAVGKPNPNAPALPTLDDIFLGDFAIAYADLMERKYEHAKVVMKAFEERFKKYGVDQLVAAKHHTNEKIGMAESLLGDVDFKQGERNQAHKRYASAKAYIMYEDRADFYDQLGRFRIDYRLSASEPEGEGRVRARSAVHRQLEAIWPRNMTDCRALIETKFDIERIFGDPLISKDLESRAEEFLSIPVFGASNIRAAKRYFYERHYRSVEGLCNKLLKQSDPKQEGDIRAVLFHAYLADGKYAEAEREANQMGPPEKHGGSYRGKIALGMVLQRQGKYQQCLDLIEPLMPKLDEGSEPAQAAMLIGECYRGLGKRDMAKKSYQNSLHLLELEDKTAIKYLYTIAAELNLALVEPDANTAAKLRLNVQQKLKNLNRLTDSPCIVALLLQLQCERYQCEPEAHILGEKLKDYFGYDPAQQVIDI